MRRLRVQRLLTLEWDIISGVVAAAAATILSYFSVVDAAMVRAIMLLLCALILVRELRNDYRLDVNRELLDIIRHEVQGIRETVGDTDIVVIAPLAMRQEFRDFATHMTGDVTWYNVCPRMFRRPEIFSATLAHLIDNPEVTAVHVLGDLRERQAWDRDVAPKLRAKDVESKVRSPMWGALSPAVSFIVGERQGIKRAQALLAIMDEPFASQGKGPSVPRYLFRVQNHSDILTAMAELARATANAFEQADQEVAHHETA